MRSRGPEDQVARPVLQLPRFARTEARQQGCFVIWRWMNCESLTAIMGKASTMRTAKSWPTRDKASHAGNEDGKSVGTCDSRECDQWSLTTGVQAENRAHDHLINGKQLATMHILNLEPHYRFLPAMNQNW